MHPSPQGRAPPKAELKRLELKCQIESFRFAFGIYSNKLGSNTMLWILSTEKDTAAAPREKRLSDSSGQFRPNSGLKSQEYSAPFLGCGA